MTVRLCRASIAIAVFSQSRVEQDWDPAITLITVPLSLELSRFLGRAASLLGEAGVKVPAFFGTG